LFRDKLAEGEANKEWTPKRLMGITGILGSLFPPSPLVRAAVAAENLCGQRWEEYERRRAFEEGQLVNYNQAANRQDRAAAREARDPDRGDIMEDPGPVNLEAMIAAIDRSSEKWKVQSGPVNLKAKIASISYPGNKWDVLDVPPWVHFADEHEAKMAADIFTVGPWRYFWEKYNAENEIWPVHCPVGWDLVKYLAGGKRDCERSQSNPLRGRGDLEWCPPREDLDQQAIYKVLRTGLSKERGRGRGSLHGWNN
jgi:hypothetical protein